MRTLVLVDGRPAEVTGEGFASEGDVRDDGRPVAAGAAAEFRTGAGPQRPHAP